MNPTPLARALEIAVVHHAGQTSKDGEPYAFHPIRVSLALKAEPEKIAGLLHDIVEDTDVTHEDLADEGFAPEVLEAVRLLTKSPGEDYDAYIARIAANPIARAVKLADLADNMNLARLGAEPSEKDLARLAKYRRAHVRLLAAAETAPLAARFIDLLDKLRASDPVGASAYCGALGVRVEVTTVLVRDRPPTEEQLASMIADLAEVLDDSASSASTLTTDKS